MTPDSISSASCPAARQGPGRPGRWKLNDGLVRHRPSQSGPVREKLQRESRQHFDRLADRQAARRRQIDAKRQQLEVQHRSERLALHATQKAEPKSVFDRIAARVFELCERVPALRSVIGPIANNPNFNRAERHRQETAALDRRHMRERRQTARRHKALDRLESRERQALVRDLERKARVAARREADRSRDFREQFAVAAGRDQMDAAPVDSADTTDSGQSAKSGWKVWQEKLARGQGRHPRRPGGFGFGR